METKDQDWSESSKSRGIGKRNTQPPKETTTVTATNSQSKHPLTSKAPSFTNGDSSQAGPTRRSQRQRGRTKRDDIAIDVSSSDSIKEIKKKAIIPKISLSYRVVQKSCNSFKSLLNRYPHFLIRSNLITI